MTMEIKAKVAQILGPHEIALNTGFRVGVEVGNVVEAWRTVAINDPDTSEPLGQVKLSKLRLSVVEVQAAFSIARVTVDSGWFARAIVGNIGPQSKRIASGGMESDAVKVSIGEEVTIYLNDRTTEVEELEIDV